MAIRVLGLETGAGFPGVRSGGDQAGGGACRPIRLRAASGAQDPRPEAAGPDRVAR
ncbi:hypothetical protein [Methylobacterium mesophilicum]|uniref:hypothetical protein n=1 Tax=Methylobacterium mesophilicum TaxID=39956 RepID=UPI001650A39D|nr:hypothetical protein [Methylobacterium mesophilicum]